MKGGFGNYYKIRETEGDIAARRFHRSRGQGDVEFRNEISVLSSLDHRNYIVELIGYVDEEDEKIIKYRDYAKGSLVAYLSDPTLTWSKRLLISLCLGDAINYIHHGLQQNYYIIHRNINSFTILLDDVWKPRLSGFEFSIKHPVDRRNQIYLCDEVIGIRGYMDIADWKHGGVTHKSDIYSFGVVLFELMCGRKAVDEDNRLLAPLAKSHYENGTLQDIIHPHLWNQMDPESFECFSEAAYSCLEEERTQRPNVPQVLSKLRKAFIIQFNSENKTKKAEYEEHKEHEEHQKDMKNRKDAEHESYTKDEEDDDEHSSHKVHNNLKHLRIRLDDIHLATNDFSQKSIIVDKYLGVIYKAELECVDREYHSSIGWKNNGKLPKRRYTVKIKYIPSSGDEVYNQIIILSDCRHRNIETLLGFCKKGQGMLLVYEYVSTKCLSNYLERDVLTWEQRLKICLDIAHGLNYLHHEMGGQTRVIHCDINSDNILLGNDLEAKVSGFGKSIYLPPNQDDDVIYLNALHGVENYYMDPEYILTRKLKRESDIYSFGVIMFEILCGVSVHSTLSKYKRPDKLVRGWLDEGIINRKVAPILKGENGDNNSMLNKGPNKDSLDRFIKIASKCFAEKQNERPIMKVIIKELKKSLSSQKINKDILRMSLEDIKFATQDFNHANNIGGGGFGRVYKGEVPKEDGNGLYTIVAKKLDTRHGQGEKQFYNELQILYEYKHTNIIGLVGYSNERDNRIIVYEHASKGSLDKYLSDPSLTWRNRLNICIDFATGLDFLHGGGNGQEVVIHRDIKAANILLLDDWKAKVGDFGLSVISTVDKKTDYIIDYACGTHGYVDPLYSESGFLTVESDIYSFGVVLFEILCGRTTFEIYTDKGQFLPSFIKHAFKERKQDEVVFDAIKIEIMPKSLRAFQNIAYQCLNDDREKRPTSKIVLAKLKKAMEFQEKYDDIFLATAIIDFNCANGIEKGRFGRQYIGEVEKKYGNKHYKIVEMRSIYSGVRRIQLNKELRFHSMYKHENIVDLVDYRKNMKRIVILYEHAPKGSLDKYLSDPSLTWKNRLKICIDFATGLDFLHGADHGKEVVIHTDIKAANVLLFDDWKAKVGHLDQRVIIIANKKKSHIIDHACGTKGYVDPLYSKSGFLTPESDIYSFGVVLFEVLCGRTTFEIYNDEGQFLPSYIKHIFEEGKQEEVVFHALEYEIVQESLSTFQNIAYQCLDDAREKRPTSKEVLAQLKMAMKFQENNVEFLSMSKDMKLAIQDFNYANGIEGGGFGRVYDVLCR